ncbi:MAG: biotin--[acetyl-CoA-carboxylase] ligase [Candidatus Kinetoplastibacterium crithidii]|nr:MAG: biotin--[acetyl-CoA-carboxylase] ligase [Candidatus Kinetoplastibacterium crithidii]
MLQILKKNLPMFHNIEWTESIDSTNTSLIKKIKANYIKTPYLEGTNNQFAGRGRQGKKWISNNDLTFSCAFNIKIHSINLPSIAIVAGISACESLRELVCDNNACLTLKWPNDIQWSNKKVSGILVETIKDHKRDNCYFAIIGIGINLNKSIDKSTDLNRPITDLSEITNQSIINREKIIKIITTISESWYKDISILEKNGLQDFHERFKKIDYLFGKRIKIEKENKMIQDGIANGIDQFGHLTLKTISGVKSLYPDNISIYYKNDCSD